MPTPTVIPPAFPVRSGIYRSILIVLFSAGLTLSLGGCLFNRVLEVRGQFCDFDSNFVVDFDGAASLVFAQPVLLSNDITWLLDAQPTFERRGNGRLEMSFVFEEALAFPDPARDVRVDMVFTGQEGNYRLESIHSDPSLNAVLNEQTLNAQALQRSAQNICETGWRFGSTEIEVDIQRPDPDALPDRREVVEWLGPPHDRLEDDTGWSYGYRLKGQTNPDLVFRVRLWFDDVTSKPVRVESRYARYRANANFETLKLSMNVEL